MNWLDEQFRRWPRLSPLYCVSLPLLPRQICCHQLGLSSSLPTPDISIVTEIFRLAASKPNARGMRMGSSNSLGVILIWSADNPNGVSPSFESPSRVGIENGIPHRRSVTGLPIHRAVLVTCMDIAHAIVPVASGHCDCMLLRTGCFPDRVRRSGRRPLSPLLRTLAFRLPLADARRQSETMPGRR